MCEENSLSLGASFTANQCSVGRLQVKLSASVVTTTKSPVRPEQNAGWRARLSICGETASCGFVIDLRAPQKHSICAANTWDAANFSCLYRMRLRQKSQSDDSDCVRDLSSAEIRSACSKLFQATRRIMKKARPDSKLTLVFEKWDELRMRRQIKVLI